MKDARITPKRGRGAVSKSRRPLRGEPSRRWRPAQMEVEPGLILFGLVLDMLSGRNPLYHLQCTFEDCDQALLFGQEQPAKYFIDDMIGRMLDRLYVAGTQLLFSALPVAALEPKKLTYASVETT